MAVVRHGAFALPWRPDYAADIFAMRERLEGSRGERDLKRGYGGSVDIEFLVQMLQLKYGCDRPALRTPNTWDALAAARDTGLLHADEYALLHTGYEFLRRVQSRLRIAHNRALDELPAAVEEREKLARRLGYEGRPGATAEQQFRTELEAHLQRIRQQFRAVFAREGGLPADG
jgi:glutamate-ammonia-ligase adenylyltransferase